MPQTIKDIRLEVKVRNNLILSKMEGLGIGSVAELCRRMGVPGRQSEVGLLVNMKKTARDKEGEWTSMALTLAEFLRCLPEDIFSEPQQWQKLERNRAHAEITYTDALRVASSNRHTTSPEVLMQADDLRQAITNALGTLQPRQERILRMRFGLGGEDAKTLDEIGEILGISRERVRSIEAEALRKLKHPARGSGILRAAGAGRRKTLWGFSEDLLDQEVLDQL